MSRYDRRKFPSKKGEPSKNFYPGKLQGKWATNVLKKTGLKNNKGWVQIESVPGQTCFAIFPDERFIVVPCGVKLSIIDCHNAARPRTLFDIGCTKDILQVAVCQPSGVSENSQVYIACGTRSGELLVQSLLLNTEDESGNDHVFSKVFSNDSDDQRSPIVFCDFASFPGALPDDVATSGPMLLWADRTLVSVVEFHATDWSKKSLTRVPACCSTTFTDSNDSNGFDGQHHRRGRRKIEEDAALMGALVSIRTASEGAPRSMVFIKV